VAGNCPGAFYFIDLKDFFSYTFFLKNNFLFKQTSWYNKASKELRTKGKASIGGFMVSSGGSGSSWSSGGSSSGSSFSGGGGSSGGGGASGSW